MKSASGKPFHDTVINQLGDVLALGPSVLFRPSFIDATGSSGPGGAQGLLVDGSPSADRRLAELSMPGLDLVNDSPKVKDNYRRVVCRWVVSHKAPIPLP